MTPEQMEALTTVLAEFPDCGHRIIGSCRDCTVAALAPTVVAMLDQAAAEAWERGAAAGHHSPLTWFALRQVNPYAAALATPTTENR